MMWHSGTRRVRTAAPAFCIGPLLAACFTTPPTPAAPAQIDVPALPRSEVAELRAAGKDRQITCETIEAERRETTALMSKVQTDRWSLICHKPILKKPIDEKTPGAVIECLAYLPFCALLGVVAVIEYEAKNPGCPDEAGRAAKDAALGQRLEELMERKKMLEALAEQHCSGAARANRGADATRR
jgi:hypothetical protein